MAALEKLKLVLVGYGKMGQLIEKHSLSKGHKIQAVIKSNEELQKFNGEADAAIDFSRAEGILERTCFFLKRKIPLVVGTTGWEKDKNIIIDEVKKHCGALLYSPNFSIGVALYLQLVEKLSKLYDKAPDYSLALVDEHHSQKKDAPSGTALKIVDVIEKNSQRSDKVDVASLRYGFVPGTHTLSMDSAFDTLTLSHQARTRDGFALGAIDAAKWLIGKTGFFTLDDLIKERYASV